MEVYSSLGGIEDVFPANHCKSWGIEFEGIAVELDEHFISIAIE